MFQQSHLQQQSLRQQFDQLLEPLYTQAEAHPTAGIKNALLYCRLFEVESSKIPMFKSVGSSMLSNK